ncbi:hypothetical protein AMATHDRAFT_146471 [Amanita thiersii Skay4041]|uniref:BTB domain-containing protein n=1 Tax=Amanita thiersii Skay4041 TaxID=703135 RepID=A0A2A9NNR5_9AGAR|nr:hypothetical protein AMATHDRAFT_146471 [Amanita thiersii Skay4041]
MPYKRDDTYYFEDGSCVLRVGDTLFNVHRSILSKDTSTFGTMFSLPQGNKECEGTTDENAVVLSGDTAQEFRHFLWALYGLPPELAVLSSLKTDLTIIIDIARIANKYSFKTLEAWALDTIHECITRHTFTMHVVKSANNTFTPQPVATPTTPLSDLPPEQITQIIHLAQLCNHERLLNTLINILIQLMRNSVKYAHLAMSVADELDLRSLRGLAYLEILQKSSVGKSFITETQLFEGSEQDSPHPDSDKTTANMVIPITPTQQLRLFTGYYRLTRAWERLRTNPPSFDHAMTCGATWHQHGCTQSWLEFWKEKTRSDSVLNLGLSDVLGKLRQVQREYERWGSATYMHHECRLLAKKSIVETIRKIEDDLPDFFDSSINYEP